MSYLNKWISSWPLPEETMNTNPSFHQHPSLSTSLFPHINVSQTLRGPTRVLPVDDPPRVRRQTLSPDPWWIHPTRINMPRRGSRRTYCTKILVDHGSRTILVVDLLVVHANYAGLYLTTNNYSDFCPPTHVHHDVVDLPRWSSGGPPARPDGPPTSWWTSRARTQSCGTPCLITVSYHNSCESGLCSAYPIGPLCSPTACAAGLVSPPPLYTAELVRHQLLYQFDRALGCPAH